MIHLDTQLLVWLYSGAARKVPASIRARLAREASAISPMAAVELQLLYEIGRVREPARIVLDDLEARIGLTLSPAPFAATSAAALDLTWTRDPFDRMIVATAMVAGAELATADEQIRANYLRAVWD